MEDKFINHLQELLNSKVKITRGFFRLLKLEARLASLSFNQLLIFFAAVVLLSITCWIAAMLLLGYLITLGTGEILWGIVSILLLNSVLLVFAIKGALIKMKHMRFEKTRALLAKKESRETYVGTRIAKDDFQSGKSNTSGPNSSTM